MRQEFGSAGADFFAKGSFLIDMSVSYKKGLRLVANVKSRNFDRDQAEANHNSESISGFYVQKSLFMTFCISM